MPLNTRLFSRLAAYLFLAFAGAATGQAAAGPDLTIALTHTSSFLRGQTNAVYLIRVSNSGVGATSGAISVVESMPSGITITTMSGPGWACLANTCTRSDSFAPGQMLPTITVLASVNAAAPASVSNLVTVSGGGDTNISDNLATDVTSIASEGRLYGFAAVNNSRLPLTYLPTSLSDAVALAVSEREALVLKKDGTLVQWDYYGQTTPNEAKALTGVVAIAMGELVCYALKSDGTVAAWSRYGSPTLATGLSNIVSIAASTSAAVAVRADGTLAAIVESTHPLLTFPAGLANVVQLSLGVNIAVALDSAGQVKSWGGSPALPVPTEKLSSVFAVANGTGAGIRPDGTVVVWQTVAGGSVAAVPSGLGGVTALTGTGYLIALKADETARGWGAHAYFRPEQANGLAHARAVAGSTTYVMAILSAPAITISFQGTAQSVDLSNLSIWPRPTITVDTVARAVPFSMLVPPDSTHTISTAAAQPGGTELIQYYFNSWSDGGAAAHAITTGTSDAVYTADFKTKFLLTISAGTGGTATPASGLYDAGATVLVRATPSNGYFFSNFSHDSFGLDAANPQRVIMNGPHTLTANFQVQANATFRLSLRPLHRLIFGQQNAAYVATVVNEGPSVQNGAIVRFDSSRPALMTGTGWACSGSSCSRSDALAPGQAYPAILIVGQVPGSTSGNEAVGLSIPSGCPGCNVHLLEPVYMNTNAVVSWGSGLAGQTAHPAGLTNLVDVTAGSAHTAALLGDGQVVAWGDNSKLQTQVPANLPIVVALAAGGQHTLALASAGQVVAWGDNSSGQTTVPGSLPTVIAVAAGRLHSLALTSDGSVVAWGANGSGQSTVPATVHDAIAIAAAGDHSLAVLRDGTVVAWGSNAAGESSVPANLQGAVSVSAGTSYSAALLDDGTPVIWGNNPPSILSGLPAGLTDVRTLSTGSDHALALRWDGTLLAWGSNSSGQTSIPAGLSGITSIAAGDQHSVVILSGPPKLSIFINTQPAGGAFSVDGVPYTGSQLLQLTIGQPHVVTTSTAPTLLDPGTQLTYQSWSDGYRGLTRTINPMSSTNYYINYLSRYKLTTTAYPSSDGSIAVSPSSPDGWYDRYQQLQITAVPTPGHRFTGFTGALTGTANPQFLTIQSPLSVTANFATYDPYPAVVSLAPAAGSGAAATFSATYSAGLGYRDLAWVQLLLAAAPDGGGQPYCFLHYDVQGDRFWVYGDGGFFQGPIQPGVASALLQNQLCGLNTKISSVAKSGTSLTFNARVAFKASAGLNVYLRAQTLSLLDTGWVQRGTWNTLPAPLGTMSVQPGAGSNGAQTFTLLYPDPTGYEDTSSGWSQFLIAASPDGGGKPFCFVHYDKAGNGLWMYSSDVGFFLGPVSPGTTSNAMDSSACSINSALSGVTHPSGTAIVYVPVTLKAPMHGTKNLYQRTLDSLSRDSGWVKTGTWTIP
ncbi:InlB B-repeat-containing protein [Paludibaculum fermentans]|uniref:InlB B-repeat-containing protein n=1 Tax=Paludibaculum fermentans TaxID=1473598 RepID=UPI003EBE7DE9